MKGLWHPQYYVSLIQFLYLSLSCIIPSLLPDTEFQVFKTYVVLWYIAGEGTGQALEKNSGLVLWNTPGKKSGVGGGGGGGDILTQNSKPTMFRGWQIFCGLEQI